MMKMYLELHDGTYNSRIFSDDVQKNSFHMLSTGKHGSLQEVYMSHRVWLEEKDGTVSWIKNRYISSNEPLIDIELEEFKVLKETGFLPMYNLYFELPDELVNDLHPKYISTTGTTSMIDNYYLHGAIRIWYETHDGQVRWWRNKIVGTESFTENDLKEFLMVKLST